MRSTLIHLIKFIETEFKQQNSSINEMIQHGITLHKNYDFHNKSLKNLMAVH